MTRTVVKKEETMDMSENWESDIKFVKKEEITDICENWESDISVDSASTYECIVNDRVYDYYFDELEESQADQVADHIETCARCQKVYKALERVVTTLKSDPEKYFANEIARRPVGKK